MSLIVGQGGLDCRHLISTLKPSYRSDDSQSKPYYPKSLTTLSTPHRGSPFMDWCMANIGIGTPRRPQNKDGNQTHIDSSKTTPESSEHTPSTESSLNPPKMDTSSSGRSTLKLPYSLEKPLLPPPPPEIQYPLPVFSTQTYTPSSFSLTALLLSLIDSPAYSNLTTSFLTQFNERTPDDPSVRLPSRHISFSHLTTQTHR